MKVPTLHVVYQTKTIHELHPVFENRLSRLKAWRAWTIMSPETTNHLEKDIRAELAKKFNRNIARMKLRTKTNDGTSDVLTLFRLYFEFEESY